MAEHARKVRLSEALDLAPAPDGPEAFDADGPVSAPAIGGLLVGSAHDPAEADADRMAGAAIRRLATRGGPLTSPGPVREHAEAGAAGHPPEGHGATPDGAPLRRSLDSAGPLAVGSAPGQAIGADGGALDGATTDRLQRTVGGGQGLTGTLRRDMETAFDRPLSHVRLHTGPDGAQMSRQMGAAAFTTGSDVFFGQGQFSPDTAEGQHTLAHEIAHTLQPDQQVRRKLAGTVDALRSQGGGKSSGRSSLISTNWDQIVSGVKAYEKLEARAAGLIPAKLPGAKRDMVAQIDKVLAAIEAWESANPDVQQGQPDRDVRTKAERRQAIAMLRPRLGNERTLLRSADPLKWDKAPVLNDASNTSWGGSAAGGKNTVQEGTWQTGTSTFTGYFKAEKGFNDVSEKHELDAGIASADPNYGARSVAMYRMDQLFDAQVTAQAEFGIRSTTDPSTSSTKTELGLVLASAQGKSLGDLDIVHRRNAGGFNGDGKEKISVQDPVLQRSLNKLQLLDAICGQLDRHAENYKINTDGQGRVTGVTGIDLDMAFGESMTNVNDEVRFDEARKVADRGLPAAGPGAGAGVLRNKAVDAAAAPSKPTQFARNFKGLPEYVDEAFGRKIMLVDAQMVRDALYGLLTDAEINATVARLVAVQAFVGQALAGGVARARWDGQTAKTTTRKGHEGPRLAAEADKGEVRNKTYLSELENRAARSLRNRYSNEFVRMSDTQTLVDDYFDVAAVHYDSAQLSDFAKEVHAILEKYSPGIGEAMGLADYKGTTTSLRGAGRTKVIKGYLDLVMTPAVCMDLMDSMTEGDTAGMDVSLKAAIDAALTPNNLGRLVVAHKR